MGLQTLFIKVYSQFPPTSQSKGHCVDSVHRQVSHHSPHDLTLTLKDNCCRLSTIPVSFDAPTLLKHVDSQIPYMTQNEPLNTSVKSASFEVLR